MILPFTKRPPVEKPAEVDRGQAGIPSALDAYKMLAAKQGTSRFECARTFDPGTHLPTAALMSETGAGRI
jgi:hypothetical protein